MFSSTVSQRLETTNSTFSFFYTLKGSAHTFSLQITAWKPHFTELNTHIANAFYHFFLSTIIHNQQPKRNWKHIHQSRMQKNSRKKTSALLKQQGRHRHPRAVGILVIKWKINVTSVNGKVKANTAVPATCYAAF